MNEAKKVSLLDRYELYELEQIINRIDANAFTNILEIANVIGFFRKD